MPFNEVQFEKDSSSTRWLMPKRELESLGPISWIMVGIGLVVTIFMICWISGPFFIGAGMIQQGQNFGWALVLFGAFGFGGLFFGLRFLILGYKLVRNQSRSEIIIRKNKLISTEKLGWFDWSRKIRLDSISELTLDLGDLEAEMQFVPDDTAMLIAKSTKKPFFVLVAYPEELTLEIANQLAAEIGKSVTHPVEKRFGNANAAPPQQGDRDSKMASHRFGAVERNIPVTVASDEDYSPTKPVDSKIIVHEKEDGTIAYEVPPVGLIKGSRGLFIFGIVWLVFCSFIFGVGLFAQPQKDAEGDLLITCLMAILFIGVGIGMLLFAIYLGRKSVMIGVLPDLLFIERRSIFGTKSLEFDHDEIHNVAVDHSGMEVNDESINELKIVQRDGKKQGLLSQLTDSELNWLAYSLNTNMGIDPIRGSQVSWQNEVRYMDQNDLRFPESSRIAMEETPQGLEIRVPSQFFGKGFLFMTVLGSVFAVIGIGISISTFPDIFTVVFGMIFSAMGCSFAAGAICWGTRSFKIRVASNRLDIERSWLFGSRLFTWEAEEIKSVTLGTSGTSVNSEKLYRLSVVGKRDGPKTSDTTKNDLNLMTWYSTKEIGIVAAILNREFNLDTLEPLKRTRNP